jgi:heptosyltransferase II
VPLPPYRRILVRATNWVGDAVMSLPALQALRRTFPDAHIAVLARPWVADLYAREPFADEVIPYQAAKGWHDLQGKWTLARHLRAGRFDCALLLQNAFEAAALSFTAGIPERIGYDRDGRGLLLTQAIALPRPGEIPQHEQFYYLELLRRAGWIDELPADDTIRLTGRAVAVTAGRERFAKLGIKRTLIGVSPGAAFGTAKRWLPERFAESASALAALLNAQVALFGSGDERELCTDIAKQIGERGQQAHNFAGTTSLREYIDLAAACRVYLTNDSGGMHIASALGVPTVAIFGATNHLTTGPTGPLVRVVREPVDCAPCLLRECPIDHRCMERVHSDPVVAAALELLQRATVLK